MAIESTQELAVQKAKVEISRLLKEEVVEVSGSGWEKIIVSIQNMMDSTDCSYDYPPPSHQCGLEMLSLATADITASIKKILKAGDNTAMLAAATGGKVAVSNLLGALEVPSIEAIDIFYEINWYCVP